MIDIEDIKKVPFVNGGRDLNGLDCWGLVITVMKRFGEDFPDFPISAKQTINIHQQVSFMKNKFKNIKPRPGAVVGLYMDRAFPQYVVHYGVCLTDRKFIHILEKHGVMITDIYHPYFKKLIAGYYEWI